MSGVADSRLSNGKAMALGIAVVLGLNLLVIGPSWLSLVKSRRQYAVQAAVTADNLAQVLEQNITGIISKADVGVFALVLEAERQLASGGIQPKALIAYMDRSRQALPEVYGLRYADARGTVIFGAGADLGPRNIADRAYFNSLRDHPRDSLLVTRPMQGRISGGWVIVLARRVSHPDGSFAGVAFAALPLETIDHLFASLQVGRYGAFALRDGADLALVARYPEPEGIGSAVGHRVMSKEFLDLLAKGRRGGTYDGPSGLDRRMRTWGFRKFGNDLYFIFVGLARDEYLADWRRGAANTVIFLGAFALVSVLAALALFLAWRRGAAAAAQRGRLEQQLLRAEKLESLGSLAGGVAHDMNNVLGAILGLAGAHLETEPADSPVRRSLETIATAAQRGGKMVQSLLSFARQSPMEALRLDLNAILLEDSRLLERTTLAQVRLELDLAPDLRPIRGDASSLAHAFMNLCVNAVDAMPVNGTLTLRTRNAEPGWIEASVEDTGCGMSEAVLAKAMDPFFTTKAQGKGTGLGLAMVFSTVKAHQGQLDIQSAPGRGTRVRLRFPVFEPTLSGDPGPAGPDPGPRPALNVLLVDDDELVQASSSAMLEALGHTVQSAWSGEEALALLAAGARPDLVILDLNMPGLGGSGTLPRLRALCPELPVLLATGRADQAALDLAAVHPGVSLLPKPFSMDDLQGLLAPL